MIFPGGGYSVLAADHEGRDYAAWLNERGITAIVVKYRVSGDPLSGNQFPVPFLDARRAIRTVRASAAELDIDPQKSASWVHPPTVTSPACVPRALPTTSRKKRVTASTSKVAGRIFPYDLSCHFHDRRDLPPGIA